MRSLLRYPVFAPIANAWRSAFNPLAIWTALQSAVLKNFSVASAYGAPALCGALAVSGLYYADRRRARGRHGNARGFVRSIFPRPALWEFHKVHHFAEVMTTLTELRQHLSRSSPS